MITSREAYIALNMVGSVGPVRVRALLEKFGRPENILTASRESLVSIPGVGKEVAENILRWNETVDAKAELVRSEKSGIHVVTRDDAAYPKNLREIYDPPLVLYVRGELIENESLAMAIVGSRRTTLYGQEMSRKLAYQLARSGVTVVSGLARGIDTAAHKGALQGKGRTVAVIGCGIDVVYPPENAGLCDDIVNGGGAIVSEFPFGVKPDRQNFPMRNRIISGWSMGVVVVEANSQSGSLITVTQATEQGRQVFAVPGRADSLLSRGTNRLIKEGAKLTEDVEDILSEFEYLMPPSNTEKTESSQSSSRPQTPLKLSEKEEKIYSCIENEEVSIDEIVRSSGLTTASVSANLLSLEMKRLVKQLPGKYFVRKTHAEL